MHKLFYDIDLTLILGDAFVFLSVFYWCTAIQFLEEFVEIWGVTKATEYKISSIVIFVSLSILHAASIL